MTLNEKVLFATGHKGPCEGNIPGVPRLGIPRFCIQVSILHPPSLLRLPPPFWLSLSRLRAELRRQIMLNPFPLLSRTAVRSFRSSLAGRRAFSPHLCRYFSSTATGLRFEAFVSQFPTAHTVAATWDRDLMEERGRGIGKEFRARGVHTHLGPVTGGPLGRSPLGGRNWEGESRSPSFPLQRPLTGASPFNASQAFLRTLISPASLPTSLSRRFRTKESSRA
jgi:hypothetical protein